MPFYAVRDQTDKRWIRLEDLRPEFLGTDLGRSVPTFSNPDEALLVRAILQKMPTFATHRTEFMSVLTWFDLPDQKRPQPKIKPEDIEALRMEDESPTAAQNHELEEGL